MNTNTIKKYGGKVIGEGSYGCIHKPALKCKKTIKMNYKNKVSKVLNIDDAKKEMREYDIINKIDKKKEYFLGKPVQCDIDIKLKKNIKELKNCEIYDKLLYDVNQISLMVIEDGGMDLNKFSKMMEKKPKNNSNIKIMKNFWKESIRLFKGLKLFIKNNVIHHDLKPQNIIYDVKKNRLNFIDFGLMNNINDVKILSKNSDNNLALFHFSFPPESGLLNKNIYINTVKLFQKYKNNKTKLNELFNYTYGNKELDYFIDIVFKSDEDIDKYIKKLYESFNKEYDINNYNSFLDKSLKTFDTYGLGLSLIVVLERTKHLIDNNTYIKFFDLFFNMINPFINERYDIDKSIKIYTKLIKNI